MKYYKICLIILFLLPFNVVLAQDGACGFNPTEKQMKFVTSKMLASSTMKTRSVLVSIPLRIHVISQDDGTGGYTQSQVDAMIEKLNSFYINANMAFFQSGDLNLINNSTFYNYNASNEDALCSPNDVRNEINLYLSGSIRSASGAPLCGYTRFPPSTDRVFVAYGCASGTTLEHEIGHYFTLYHTHGKTNTGTTDELANGSNCTTAGDDICDTPADPNLGNNNVQGCAYTGSEKDANGDVFRPDPSNIMSYAPDQCARGFTSGQYERARRGFENGRAYLNFTSSGFTANFFSDLSEICIDNSVGFKGISFGANQWKWTFEGGTPATSSAQNPIVSYNSPGQFKVSLTVQNSVGDEVTISRDNYVSVTSPLLDAVDTDLVQIFDGGLPSNIEVENPDNQITFSYNANVSKDNDGSGCLFLDHFAYEADVLGNKDYYYLPYYDLEGVSKINISFDYAYTGQLGGIEGENIILDAYDSLSLLASTSCDNAEFARVWTEKDVALITAPSQNTPFVPSGPNEWKNITADFERKSLTEEFVLLYFESISQNGNRLYIDNIKITPDFSVNAPSNLRKSSVASNSLILRWTDNSINELGFVIERSEDGGAFTEIARVAENVINYQENDIELGITYRYRVYAYSKFDNKSTYTPELLVADFVTSLEDNHISGLSFYPNPANQVLNMRLESPLLGEINVSLVDLTGKEVVNFSTNKKGSVYEGSIDTSLLPSGVYLIKFFVGDNGTISKVFVY